MKHTSLRAGLLFSFIIASVLPITVATFIAVPWYRSSIENEAQRKLETHASVMEELFKERSRTHAAQAEGLGRTLVANFDSPASVQQALKRRVSTIEAGHLMYFDADGVMRASTTGGVARTLEWPALERAVRSAEATTFVSIAPRSTLAGLELDSRLRLAVKETEGGSAPQSEADGALSMVAVAPVTSGGRRQGTIVILDVIKLDNTLVDSVASQVGGVATIFQHGVRITTTVKDDAGKRAIGTAISDKVRAVTLDTGKPFRGEAFVVNKAHITAYDAIIDSEGRVVGMLFVGLDRAPYVASERAFGLGMGGVSILSLLLAIVFAFAASNTISRPFKEIGRAADHVATGDLTVAVPEAGFAEGKVLAHAFNTMIGELSSLIGRVGSSADRLDGVSREISHAASLEADGATSQASAVAQASATVEELNRSFGAVSDGARRVLEIAEDSLAVAEQGRTAVEGGAGHVERLASGAHSVREAAGQLASVADDIGQVTVVIDSIAEQTKILALNAAIEAARAGEAGRGFGVVATEIRGLADSVSTSIGRIETLVRSIQQSSATLSEVAERQAELGEVTVGETARTRDSFDAIYERMDRTASAAREIATAAEQQQSAARAIVDVMQQVSQGVSATAASARQLAGSAGAVEHEARDLSGSMQGFRTD